MTVRELYRTLFECALPLYGAKEAGAVASRLMEDRFGMDRVSMALGREWEQQPEGVQTVLDDLAAGRPVQYITGKAYFCGLELYVAEGVLIPRPETEELVQWVTSQCGPETRILDVGTGSGAIAVALASARPGATVTATDVSPEALKIARDNAVTAGAEIEFLLNDILDHGAREELARRGPFDVIVSNPPYIPAGEASSMHTNVTGYEPHGALFVPEDDPLLFYREIAGFTAANLSEGGRLFFEVHKDFARQTGELLRDRGFSDVEVRLDMFGRERMVRGIKPVSDG